MFYSKQILLLLILGISCSQNIPDGAKESEPFASDFKSYWYDNKAEINHYRLSQARYGELRDSSVAILLFVTEDFLTDKQVKSDNAGKGTSVLKMNFIRRFVTGIYDYSMMASVFTPVNRVEFPNTLKVTTSSQDWCGHTFMQMNFKNNQYRVASFSYFESEGDENFDLDRTFLEDELWTLIRIAPDKLPKGKIKMIPGTMQSRLRHKKLSVESAEANTQNASDNLKVYTIYYSESERTLKIFFENKFPYKITGWEETYKDGFGDKAKMLTTKAELIQTALTDYWKKNENTDITWRDSLKLNKTF